VSSTNASISLNFIKSSDNGGALISNYYLEMRLSISNTYSPVTTYTDNSMSHTLTTVADGLVAGKIYYFRFYAANSRGNSPYSNEMSVVCEYLPDPPSNLYKDDSMSTLTSIFMRWSQVPDTNTPVQGYRLYMDTGNTGDYSVVFDGYGYPGILKYNATNLY
jgi:hypothetical protein